MKKFEIEVDINGKITFEVQAKNKAEAEMKVDELLGNVSLKKAIEDYQNNIALNTRVKEYKCLER